MKNRNIFSRQLSSSERLYTGADHISGSFSIQMVVEGTGAIDMDRLNLAVKLASEANPGSRLVLKGCMGAAKWVDSGVTPPVRIMEGSSWDGMSYKEMPDIWRHLDPWNGPTCEVVVIEGNPVRYVFRCFHGVMDGGGLLIWAQEIFRALRGEKLHGTDSSMTDFQLLNSFEKKHFRPDFRADCCSPTGRFSSRNNRSVWYRVKLEGNYPAPVAQVAAIASSESRRIKRGCSARYLVSTDMRLMRPDIRSTANLSSPIYLEVPDGAAWKDVYRTIIKELAAKKQINVGRFDFLVRHIPMFMITSGIRLDMLKKKITNRFELTGMISHSGKLNRDLLSGAGFIPDTLFFIPVLLPITSLFAGISETDSQMELVICMPEGLADQGRIENFIEAIKNGLESKI